MSEKLTVQVSTGVRVTTRKWPECGAYILTGAVIAASVCIFEGFAFFRAESVG